MQPTGALVEQGRAAAPARLGRTAFLDEAGATSESDAKVAARDAGEITYHMHLGLNDWPSTVDALREVDGTIRGRGRRVHRYGLCLDRAMSLPEDRRNGAAKETGPRLSVDEWGQVGWAAPVQPHMGDHMIGTEASLENTVRALAAGVTTIGNLGQYFAFRSPGGDDPVAVTEATVSALGAMAARRDQGALVHSYLDDGPAVQFDHYGQYLGWAAIELYVVEELLGGRLAHCYGGLVHEPPHRAVVGLALDDLRGRDSVGSMVYGNTVDYGPDHRHNEAVLATYLLVDIATQLHRPTGHAVNPVPLTEAERIPSAEEIVAVHAIAHRIEEEARRSGALFDWARLDRLAAAAAEYATAFRDEVLGQLEDQGVDVRDAAALLLALRRAEPAALMAGMTVRAPREVAALEPWKAGHVRTLARRLAVGPPLHGRRVVLAVLEAHDVVRDALAAALPALGAEVVVLDAAATPEQVAAAAVQEDADAVVVGTYNGGALDLGTRLRAVLQVEGWEGAVIFGGVLNADLGDALPVDVRPRLEVLGITCVADAADVAPVIAAVGVEEGAQRPHARP
jgi:methylmalonyl-CoA mutase cobalamin-binding domain/chain